MELKRRFQNIYADEDYILKVRAWYLFLFNLASVFMNSVALAMFLYKNVQFLPASFLIFFLHQCYRSFCFGGDFSTSL